MRIYVAGPLGFSEAGRFAYYDLVIPKLTALGHEVLDPWKLTPSRKIEAINRLAYGSRKRQAWRRLNAEMGRRNAGAIERCDAVFAILDGVDVDSGTAAEIGFAFALGKPILGYRGDFRLSADNEGCNVNLQVEHFIHASGGSIITALERLPAALTRLARRKVRRRRQRA